ncbi:MAG: homocysteine S-methyltransferase family protein [Pirellulales bacterium]
MSRYRSHLPQLAGGLFVTDGGLETDLIFHDGYSLPQNASYVLLDEAAGVARLTRYFEDYLAIADEHGLGVVLETATWRASPDWAAKIGTPPATLAELNRKAVEMLVALRDRRAAGTTAHSATAAAATPFVVSGCLGPRSDAYQPTEIMTPREAEDYHAVQINTFRDTDADMICAMTITNIPEALGIVRASQAAQMPVAISFTVETDGRLPTGPTLREAIEQVDSETHGAVAYYMINCAHPTHFERALEPGEPWTERIGGLRANSSSKSHAELNESPTIDEGNPVELGGQYRTLVQEFPHFRVLGGCCGTDHRHIREIATACTRRS